MMRLFRQIWPYGVTSKRPWYGLHALTWFVTVLLLGSLGYRELEARPGIGIRPGIEWLRGRAPGDDYTDWYYFGWPGAHLEKVESGSYEQVGGKLIIFPQSYDYHWRWKSLAANLFCCLVILSATCVCCESWLRGRNRQQISLRVLVVFLVVVGILFGWLVNMERPHMAQFEVTEYDLMDDDFVPIYWVQSSLVEWYDFLRPTRWPVVAGIACTLYAGVWFMCGTSLYAWSLLRHIARRIAQLLEGKRHED
jgi:hypothetical protein